jgi:hypothetical protein
MDKESSDHDDHSSKVAANVAQDNEKGAPKDEEEQEKEQEQAPESVDDDDSSSSGADQNEEEGERAGGNQFRADGAPHEISVPSSITTSQATTGRSSRGSRKRRRQPQEEANSCHLFREEVGSSSIVAGAPIPGMRPAASNAPYRVVAHSSVATTRRPTANAADTRRANRLNASAARRHNRKQRREQERRRLEQENQRHFARQVSDQLLELERTFNEARQQLGIPDEGEEEQQDGNDNNSPPALPAGGGSPLPVVPLLVARARLRSGYEADEETASSGGDTGRGIQKGSKPKDPHQPEKGPSTY